MVRKLYICPPETPETVVTRCVRVPANQEWLAVFNRALLMLTDPAQWEQLNETDITPDEAAAVAYDVYQEWLSGECSLNCEDVLACVQTVIEDIIAQGTINVNTVNIDDSTVIEQRFDTASRNTAILPPPDACNKDELWAGILEIVTRIDENGRDWWEIIVAQTDTLSRIAEAIALVPLFGDLIGEGLELLIDIAPTMRDQYVAYSTLSVIEAIACDLFQLVCGECRYPTYQEVYDYYSGNSALGAAHWEELALKALVDVVIGTELASAGIIYYTTNILQLWVLAAGAQWLETHGVQFVALWAGIGSSDPSDAWELLCGPCGSEPSPCEGIEAAFTFRYGTTYEAVEGNDCIFKFTSGPAQSDGDYYVALDTRQLSAINFRVDTSSPSGLSLVNCRWSIDGGAGHFTNIAGLEAVSSMDDFYIRSNTSYTIFIEFTLAS